MTEDTSAERNRSSVRPPRGDSTTVSEPSPGGLTAFGKQLPVVILVTVGGLPAGNGEDTWFGWPDRGRWPVGTKGYMSSVPTTSDRCEVGCDGAEPP